MKKHVTFYTIAFRGNGGEPLMGTPTYLTRAAAEKDNVDGCGLRYGAFIKPVRVTQADIKRADDMAAWVRSQGQEPRVLAYIEEARRLLIG